MQSHVFADRGGEVGELVQVSEGQQLPGTKMSMGLVSFIQYSLERVVMDQETAHGGENGNSCCIGVCTKNVACNVRLFLQEANWAPHRQLTDCVKREIVDELVETHSLATCSNLAQEIQIEIHHLGNQLFHTQDSGH